MNEQAESPRTLAMVRGARELSKLAAQELDSGHLVRAMQLLGDARELARECRRRLLKAERANRKSGKSPAPVLTPIDGGATER